MVFNPEKVLEVAQFISQGVVKKKQTVTHPIGWLPVHVDTGKTKMCARPFPLYTVRKSQVGHFSLEVKFKVNVIKFFDVTCFT